MLNTSSGFSMTCNLVAERKPARRDNTDFKRLVFDSVISLRRGNAVYIFTQEQLDAIVKCFKVNVLAWEQRDYYYMIWRI